jgi:hypothetical protein
MPTTIEGWSALATLVAVTSGFVVWLIRQFRQRIYNVKLSAKACIVVVSGYCVDATNNVLRTNWTRRPT